MSRPEAMEVLPFLERKWWVGRPAEIWISQIPLIESIIKRNKLQPMDMKHYPVLETGMQTVARTTATKSAKVPIFDPRPFPGGLRQPHVHYGTDIYILDRKQWQDFSSKVMADLRANLEAAKTVGFEQLVEMEEIVGSIM